MKIWVGLKRDEKYIREWTGNVEDADDTADAVREVLRMHSDETDEPLWNLTIKVDVVPLPNDDTPAETA
jgi:hypothetical protein